ncbi:MAG: hypothetical protein K9I69_07620 [Ignavibacteriales bacterium]|nr:hypothetical protein [Ignavibacteriales bacterium]MCF8316577.1 hypothetical protein [Ignavibacteriales bacterium]MCF8437500.1 hypothetical protein [Ignavibacteriales bacterium]
MELRDKGKPDIYDKVLDLITPEAVELLDSEIDDLLTKWDTPGTFDKYPFFAELKQSFGILISQHPETSYKKAAFSSYCTNFYKVFDFNPEAIEAISKLKISVHEYSEILIIETHAQNWRIILSKDIKIRKLENENSEFKLKLARRETPPEKIDKYRQTIRMILENRYRYRKGEAKKEETTEFFLYEVYYPANTEQLSQNFRKWKTQNKLFFEMIVYEEAYKLLKP